MKARDWYSAFRKECELPQYAAPNTLFGPEVLQRPEWTGQMRALIGNLAGKLGYAASPEAPFAGGTHFDILWQKDEDEVYIEHENRDRGIFSSEIPKLMRVNADLRVLITYTARSKLQSKGNEIVEFILGQLSKKKKVQTFEVLLVIGPRDITGPSEFLAWQFTPTSIYASDALVHP